MKNKINNYLLYRIITFIVNKKNQEKENKNVVFILLKKILIICFL